MKFWTTWWVASLIWSLGKTQIAFKWHKPNIIKLHNFALSGLAMAPLHSTSDTVRGWPGSCLRMEWVWRGERWCWPVRSLPRATPDLSTGGGGQTRLQTSSASPPTSHSPLSDWRTRPDTLVKLTMSLARVKKDQVKLTFLGPQYSGTIHKCGHQKGIRG